VWVCPLWILSISQDKSLLALDKCSISQDRLLLALDKCSTSQDRLLLALDKCSTSQDRLLLALDKCSIPLGILLCTQGFLTDEMPCTFVASSGMMKPWGLTM